MKYVLMFVLLLLLAGAYAHPFEYISPLPDSRYHRPQTNVIIRTGNVLSMNEQRLLKEQVAIVGASSGRHAYKLVLSDGGRVAVLEFDRVFADGEAVSVTLPSGLYNAQQEVQQMPFVYRFYISPPRNHTPERIDEERMAGACNDLRGGSVYATEVLGETGDGSVIFANSSSLSYNLNIVNNNGEVEWVKNEASGYDLEVHHDTLLAYANFFAGTGYKVLDRNYTQVRTYNMGNGYGIYPLELVILPNGNGLVLAHEGETFDMSTLVSGGKPTATVIQSVVQEVTQSGTVVWQWRSLDFTSPLDGIYNDNGAINFTANTIDYSYINSMCIDPADGNLLLNHRNMCEVMKVNRTTGAIMWRFGGKNNEFTFIDDVYNGFTRQHHARLLPNRHLTIFDNGLFHEPPLTRAIEYAMDFENKTATLVRTIANPNTGNAAIAPQRGAVHRLPNGNTFINWGQINNSTGNSIQMSEVDSLDNTVFTLRIPTPGSAWIYRASRNVWPPQQPTSATAELPLSNADGFSLSPVPAQTHLRVTFNNFLQQHGVVGISVTNLLGIELLNVSVPNPTDAILIPTEQLPQGVYALRVHYKGGSIQSRLFTALAK